MRWNCKRSFFKNHGNCSLGTSTKCRLFRTSNSYSFNFKGGLCNRRTGYCPYRAPCPGSEQVSVIFEKWPLAISPYFALFDSIKRSFLEMCLVRRTMANLCPIMIHFNALDFNECRSEEVISFFWRSVYIQYIPTFTVFVFLKLRKNRRLPEICKGQFRNITCQSLQEWRRKKKSICVMTNFPWFQSQKLRKPLLCIIVHFANNLQAFTQF